MDDSHNHARRLVFRNIAAEADAFPERAFNPITPARAPHTRPATNGWLVLIAALVSLAVSVVALVSAMQSGANDRISQMAAGLSADASQLSAVRAELSALKAPPQHAVATTPPSVRSSAHRHHRAAAAAQTAPPQPAAVAHSSYPKD